MPVELDHFTRLRRLEPKHRAAAGKCVNLPSELSAAGQRDDAFAQIRRSHRFELAGEDDEKRNRGVALLDENLAGAYFANVSTRLNAFDLGIGQRREDLIGRPDERNVGGAHDGKNTSNATQDAARGDCSATGSPFVATATFGRSGMSSPP